MTPDADIDGLVRRLRECLIPGDMAMGVPTLPIHHPLMTEAAALIEALRKCQSEMLLWRAAIQRLTPGGSEFMTPAAVEEYALMLKRETVEAKLDRAKESNRASAAAIRSLSSADVVVEGWREIESAPKGQKIIAGYFNEAGKWRTVTACYYPAGTLEIYEDRFETEDGYAPEGWYEESETHEELMPMTQPTYWQPLPTPPAANIARVALQDPRP